MSAAEFEEFEELEEFEALDQADDAVEAVGDVFEEDATAATSLESGTTQVAETATTAATSATATRMGWLSNLSVYDAMLLTALVLISLACLLMLTELFSFGFPFFQWRTGEALVEPLRPPV